MTPIKYPTCIDKCYIPKNASGDYEIYDGKLLGKTRYYELNPCMIRLKFAQLAVTDWIIQPIMIIAMIVAEVYMAIRFLFNCLPEAQQIGDLKERAKIAGGMFLHALSLPFVMFIPALLAAYSVIDVKNGRHAYCAVERYMYDAMGISKHKLDEMDICSSWKPFSRHVAKPFAPVEIVDKYEKLRKAPKTTTEVSAKEKLKDCTTKTVVLDETATQYRIEASEGDPKNEHPSACTFHALVAMSEIAENFEDWCIKLQNENSAELSAMQKAVIKRGLNWYRRALKIDLEFKEGSDLVHIKKTFPEFLKHFRLELGNTDEGMSLVEARVYTMVDVLFGDPNEKRVAWIKTNNDESFAVICHQNLAIVFDSHKNKLSLLSDKKDARKFLTDKLSQHTTVVENVDMTPFHYATGRSK